MNIFNTDIIEDTRDANDFTNYAFFCTCLKKNKKLHVVSIEYVKHESVSTLVDVTIHFESEGHNYTYRKTRAIDYSYFGNSEIFETFIK